MKNEKIRTILLVEDESDIAKKMSCQLEKRGYRVFHAPDGKMAVRTVLEGENDIDLILMDIDPGDGMDGREAAGIIFEKKDLPLIFLSEPGMADIIEKTAGIASHGLLVKNVPVDIIDASIRMALELFEKEAGVKGRTLQEVDMQYRLLVENLDSGINLLDEKGNFLIVNEVAARVWGRTPEELVGKNIRDILPREMSDDALEIIGKVNIEGSGIQQERYIAPLNRHFIENIQPVYDDKGNFLGVQVLTFDITDRKQAEERLKESEERWQFALEGARDGVWDWNAETNEVFYSRQWQEMLGYSPDDIMGNLDDWDSRVHPDDKEKCYADLNRHLNGETPFYENEHRVLCKDGTYKWILDRGKVISWTKDKKPERVIGTHSDIADRKQAEETLRQYKHIVFNSRDMLALLDEHYRYLAVNSAYGEAFGLSPEEMVGNSVSEIFGETFFTTVIRPRAEECLAGNEVNYQDWFSFPVYGRRYMDISYYPYLSSDSAIAGFVVNGRNITARKLAEDALEEKTFNLNERVKELKCLYGITSIVEREGSTLEDILQGTVELIPPSWRFPEETCARINILENSYYSAGFMETDCRLSYDISSRGERIGIVEVYTGINDLTMLNGEDPFLKEEKELIKNIAERLGKIVERMELKKEVLDISEKERIRIGQALHDGVGQDLTGISYLFKVVMNKLLNAEFPENDEIAAIMKLIDDTKTHVRMLSRGLSPVNVENDGIVVAVKDLCSKAEKIFDIQCELDYDEVIIHDNSVATHVFYIIQESLNNAVKHGKAKNIRISLKNFERKLKIIIEDDGKGLGNNSSNEKGLGLELMKYRVDIIGGTFQLSEKEPSGVIVSCLLELNDR